MIKVIVKRQEQQRTQTKRMHTKMDPTELPTAIPAMAPDDNAGEV